MGCFLSCFRVSHQRSHTSHSARPNSNEPVISKNRLSNLFVSDDKEDYSGSDEENPYLESRQFDKGLKDEARFLKACGTLTETPVEIRKPSKKPPLGQQLDQLCTPSKLREECGREALPHSSCMSAVQRIARNSESCNTGNDIQCKSKSVRFECDFDMSSKSASSGHDNEDTKNIKTPCNQRLPKASPNPTPLKLSEEMQTPGTVFPTNLNTLASKNTRIRSQYVYAVRDPVENISQGTELKDADSESHQVPSQLSESIGWTENPTPKSDNGMSRNIVGKDFKVETAMSAWLKPPASANDDNNVNVDNAFGRTPGDRPIIGMVAAHWNEETSHATSKWWDGNGIPNSTTKYKEDQRVSYHATPFEERLEKALSEESFISQRKHIEQNPIVFEENEDSDTALSSLQAPIQSKTVVSF